MSQLPNRKSFWLISILTVALLVTNALWFAVVIRSGFDYNDELARTNRALDASMRLMPLIKPGAADSTIISEALELSPGETVDERGCVRVGDLAFVFDENGKLIHATRGWQLPPSDPCSHLDIPRQ